MLLLMGNSGTRRHPGAPCAYNQLAHMYTFIVTNMEEPGHWQCHRLLLQPWTYGTGRPHEATGRAVERWTETGIDTAYGNGGHAGAAAFGRTYSGTGSGYGAESAGADPPDRGRA